MPKFPMRWRPPSPVPSVLEASERSTDPGPRSGASSKSQRPDRAGPRPGGSHRARPAGERPIYGSQGSVGGLENRRTAGSGHGRRPRRVHTCRGINCSQFRSQRPHRDQCACPRHRVPRSGTRPVPAMEFSSASSPAGLRVRLPGAGRRRFADSRKGIGKRLCLYNSFPMCRETSGSREPDRPGARISATRPLRPRRGARAVTRDQGVSYMPTWISRAANAGPAKRTGCSWARGGWRRPPGRVRWSPASHLERGLGHFVRRQVAEVQARTFTSAWRRVRSRDDDVAHRILALSERHDRGKPPKGPPTSRQRNPSAAGIDTGRCSLSFGVGVSRLRRLLSRALTVAPKLAPRFAASPRPRCGRCR